MSFDLAAMKRLAAAHGAVVRVVVAEVAGSAPREAGAAMTLWATGQEGTIGGGALEYEAAARARALLSCGAGGAKYQRLPLGPALGQCCGGAVGLLTEVWDEAALASLEDVLVVRPLPGKPGEMPLAVHRLLAKARGEGAMPQARILQGWFVEPMAQTEREIWIWGAGHVGRALVEVLRPLPGVRVTWVDVAQDRFCAIPDGVVQRIAANPADLVAEAPGSAEHLVATFSHALDLEICHRLLGRGFARLGLIGSATKWARFRSRLLALGHKKEAIETITCPIGDPTLGKHPQAIAIGVAARILKMTGDKAGECGAGQSVAQGGRAG